MTMLRRKTPRGTSVYKIERKVGDKNYVSKTWYYRSSRGGRSTVIPLGRVWTEATRLADHIDSRLRFGEWTIEDACRQHKRRSIGRSADRANGTVKLATIGEVVDTFREITKGMNMAEATIYKYTSCLIRMVRKGLEKEEKGMISKEEARVRSSAILTEDLVNDFKQASRLTEANNLQDQSRMRTTNSTIRSARGIFSAGARSHFRTAGLELPNLDGFMSSQLFPNVGQKYRLPETEVIERVMRCLRTGGLSSDQNIHLAAHLAAFAGLRQKEIMHARWNWLSAEDGYFIEVIKREDFLPKGTERRIPIEKWFYDFLMQFKREPTECILVGADNERTNKWHRRLNAELKTTGLNVQKRIHELRKWYGSYIAATKGLTFAQAYLGHSTPTLTFQSYSDVELPTRLFAYWGELKFD